MRFGFFPGESCGEVKLESEGQSRAEKSSSSSERRPRVRRNVTVAIAQDICADRYPSGSPLPREND
ncbi:hypothetical protein ACE04B_28855, partial [Rhizobium phaseoli]